MDNLKILNNKEIKSILKKIEGRFGFKGKLDYAFLQNNKNRLFLINKELGNIDTSKLRINSVGMYFAELHNQEIRLSIEGAQLIGKDCEKNILDLDDNEKSLWLQGIDLDKEVEQKGYYIIKHDEDFLGCGKAVEKKLLNFVPKNRRVRVNN